MFGALQVLGVWLNVHHFKGAQLFFGLFPMALYAQLCLLANHAVTDQG